MDNRSYEPLGLFEAAKFFVDEQEMPSAAPMAGDPKKEQVESSWQKLGENLSFVPLADGLAVIVVADRFPQYQVRPGFFSLSDWDQVANIVTDLRNSLHKTHPHAAVAVVAETVTDFDFDKVFNAGGQAIALDSNFSAAISNNDVLRNLLIPPQVLSTKSDMPRLSVAKPSEVKPGEYDGINSALTGADIEEWMKLVTTWPNSRSVGG